MRISLFILSLLVSLCFAAVADDSLLIVNKEIKNEYAVSDHDLIIQFSIYNVGTKPALDVVLEDDSWNIADFEHVIGLPEARWAQINAGENVTYSFVLKPRIGGEFKSVPGTVTFKTEAGETRKVMSTDLGTVYIIPNVYYQEMNNLHLIEWATFGAGILILCGLPLAYYAINQKARL